MTIGFFSPLPLAYMVPFMAAQSLAMGEAFGKSFQFGKRKISAMSNEDFNKFTFQDMNNELVADIASLLPTMNNQLNQSIELQKNIFKHMLGLIPVFINEVAIAANQVIGNFASFGNISPQAPTSDNLLPLAGAETTNFNQGTVTPLVETQSTTTTSKYSQAIFRAMPINELIKGINSGRFTGSDLSLARHVLATRQQPTDSTRISTAITSQFAASAAFRNQYAALQKEFIDTKTTMQRLIDHKPIAYERQVAHKKNELQAIVSKIRTMSNQYRDPNDGIRRQAIKIRQDLASNAFKY